MELLRFLTAGNVDDGKSTLIGRLLYDSGSVPKDQIEAVERSSAKLGFLNLALLTDGLKSEREQGITIDVAYRYFNTDRRKFIIADTPGHVQYTRNMVTGASHSNLIVVLVDARAGITEQTRRHSYIASLLGIPHLVVCINKMDLVEYSQERFEEIRKEYTGFASRLAIRDIVFLPVSALTGDNVVHRSTNMPWYDGPALLSHLENVYIESDTNRTLDRFPVQTVIRPGGGGEYRAYAGSVASGTFRAGMPVKILPSGFTTSIDSIDTFDGPLGEARAPQAVAIRLKDDIDVSRGDMIVSENSAPHVAQDISAVICWMDSVPLKTGNKYILRHTTRESRIVLRSADAVLDMQTLEFDASPSRAPGMNDIARVTIRSAQPIVFDTYEKNRSTGSFILIDESSNLTVAAGVITGEAE